jgi:hypothetical protein
MSKAKKRKPTIPCPECHRRFLDECTALYERNKRGDHPLNNRERRFLRRFMIDSLNGASDHADERLVRELVPLLFVGLPEDEDEPEIETP